MGWPLRQVASQMGGLSGGFSDGWLLRWVTSQMGGFSDGSFQTGGFSDKWLLFEVIINMQLFACSEPREISPC